MERRCDRSGCRARARRAQHLLAGPLPDRSVHPAAGGRFPSTDRSTRPEAQAAGRAQDRVPGRLAEARQAGDRDGRKGFKVRPSEDTRHLSKRKARKLKQLNKRFAKKCDYDSIQDAVNDSGNNDGSWSCRAPTQSRTRGQPEDDPACANCYRTPTTRGAVSLPLPGHLPQRPEPDRDHRARAADVGTPGAPSRSRRGIPDEGRCIRYRTSRSRGRGEAHRCDMDASASTRPSPKGAKAKPGTDHRAPAPSRSATTSTASASTAQMASWAATSHQELEKHGDY